MSLVHFSVSQVRVAAACPRILFFDDQHTRNERLKQPVVTQIWKGTDGTNGSTALGQLFHKAVEQFNSKAARTPAVRQLLESDADVQEIARDLQKHIYLEYVNQDKLFSSAGPQQQNFMTALKVYAQELADVLCYGLRQKMSVNQILQQMFGDPRKRVDVTFHVGPGDTAVHVSGVLDYLFYDWRRDRRRIIDYKLTPSQQPATDLTQVCIYALMHHKQHGTEPDVTVLYLHPQRQMVEKPWEEIYAQRHVIYDLLASMAAWVRYDPRSRSGLKPPGEPLYCDRCRWAAQCSEQLGPKHEGDRHAQWSKVITSQKDTEPRHETRQPSTREPLPDRDANRPNRSTVPVKESPKQTSQRSPATDELAVGRFENDKSPVGVPIAALPMHVAVVGAAGSGKTFMAKVFAEEVIRQGVPVLAVDPQGDLVQFLRRTPADKIPPDQRDLYEQFWQRVEPRIFTPGSSHGVRLSLNPLRLPCEEDLVHIGDVARRSEEIDDLLAATATNLVNLADVGGETDSQQTFVMQLLRRLRARQSEQQLQLEDIASAVSAPDNLGLEDADDWLPKTQRGKLARKLKTMLEGPAAKLFGGGWPLDMDQMCRPLTNGKTPLNVIYLNALIDNSQKQFFAAALATEIYRWMVSSLDSRGKMNLLFYLDEARDFIPAGSAQPPAKKPLIRLFTQGRKYGVGCLLCTQSPRSVDYNVFGNCSTKFIGRLESAQDVDRVADWFTTQGTRPEWLNQRKAAAAGTFVARWPKMRRECEGREIKSRMVFSLHEGAWSPDRVEREMLDDPIRRTLNAAGANASLPVAT